MSPPTLLQEGIQVPRYQMVLSMSGMKTVKSMHSTLMTVHPSGTIPQLPGERFTRVPRWLTMSCMSAGLDQYIYAIGATNGTRLWRYSTDGGVVTSPAVANGIVYYGSFDNYLYARDARTGAFRWSSPTGGGIYSSPAVANGVVYVGS